MLARERRSTSGGTRVPIVQRYSQPKPAVSPTDTRPDPRSPVLETSGREGGLPLDDELRRAVEGRLGESFDTVRLHVDARSTESGNAKAYTEQSRNGSGAAGLPPGQPAVVQRKLRVGDTLYGKGDDEQLQRLKVEQGLPAWTKPELEGDDHYVLNTDGSAWVKDTMLLFYRHKYLRGQEPSGKQYNGGYASPKLYLSGGDPLAAVGFGSGDKARVGPKHPDRRTVSKISLFNYETTLPDGHWMLQCDVEQGEGGKTGTKKMKIDLVGAGYRVYYGVTQQTPVKNAQVTQDEIHFQLRSAVALRAVYDAFLAVAKEKGNWTGTHDYNCQDFALAMLAKLGVADQDQQRLERAAEWRAGAKSGEDVKW